MIAAPPISSDLAMAMLHDNYDRSPRLWILLRRRLPRSLLLTSLMTILRLYPPYPPRSFLRQIRLKPTTISLIPFPFAVAIVRQRPPTLTLPLATITAPLHVIRFPAVTKYRCHLLRGLCFHCPNNYTSYNSIGLRLSRNTAQRPGFTTLPNPGLSRRKLAHLPPVVE